MLLPFENTKLTSLFRTFSSLFSPFILLLTVGLVGAPWAASAQELPTGTGFLWRNLEVRPISCAFSPDGQHIACGLWGRSKAERIAVLDAKTGELLRSFGKEEFGDRPVELLAWSPDGARLAGATNYVPQSEDGERGALYEMATGEVLNWLDLESASRIRNLVFNEAGTRLVAASIPEVYHWDTAGQGPAGTVLLEMRTVPLDMEEYGGEAAQLSPTSRQLATGRDAVVLWSADTGKRQSVLKEPSSADGRATEEPYTSLLFSDDGRWLAGATNAGRVTVWNAETGEKQAGWTLVTGGKLPSRAAPSLYFLDEGPLATYFPSLGQIHVSSVATQETRVFDAPKGSAGGGRMVGHGDRFVFPSTGARPLALHLLCRGSSPCGNNEGVTPARLAKLLPATIAGIGRTGNEGRWGESGPKASAFYMEANRGLEIEINGLSKGEVEEMRLQYENRAAREEGIFSKTVEGRAVYGGGGEERSGLVVLLRRGAVMMEGNLPSEKLLAVLGELPLGQIEALLAGPNADR